MSKIVLTESALTTAEGVSSGEYDLVVSDRLLNSFHCELAQGEWEKPTMMPFNSFALPFSTWLSLPRLFLRILNFSTIPALMTSHLVPAVYKINRQLGEGVQTHHWGWALMGSCFSSSNVEAVDLETSMPVSKTKDCCALPSHIESPCTHQYVVFFVFKVFRAWETLKTCLKLLKTAKIAEMEKGIYHLAETLT